MFTLDTYVLVKCTYFIVWISDGHRGYSLHPISLSFALLCFLHNQQCHSSVSGVYDKAFEWLHERTEHLIVFPFSTHHSMVFCFRCSVYWWKGSVRF